MIQNFKFFNMKKLISYSAISLLTLLCFTIFSCEDGLEDETFSVFDANALTKPGHGEQAVRGVYASLKDNGGYGYYGGYLYWLYEYPTDVSTTTPTANQGQQLDQLTYNASNAVINETWRSIYRLIARANEAESLINGIDYVGNGSTEEQKQQHLGEVRFLRALAYYDATSLWGSVPLMVKPSAEYTINDENPELTDKAVVEEAIIDDLLYAEEALPLNFPTDEIARATSSAAKGLLMRLYMRQGEWQKATDKAQEVINQSVYDLRTQAEGGIIALFQNNNRSDNEFMFVLKSSDEVGAYGVNSNSFGINSVPWDYNRGWGNFPLRLEFYDDFSANDDRRELLTGSYETVYGQIVTVPEEYGGIGGSAPDTLSASYIYNLKYPHVNNYNYGGFNNVPILRYADILLMRAEALNELSGPNQESINLISQVRTRSGLNEVQVSDFSSRADLRDFIFEERNKEFFMEGRRRDDLIRWGTSATDGANPLVKFREKVVPMLADPNTYSEGVDYRYFPYPLAEIDSNLNLDSSINEGRVRN